MCPTVLIVDDSRLMIEMLSDIFRKEGYEIIGEAEYGQESIELYKKLKPDLVSMDIIMPDMTGVEALKGILAFDPNAKVIMCSSLTYESLILDAIKAGAKGYIKKPFRPLEVILAARKAVGL